MTPVDCRWLCTTHEIAGSDLDRLCCRAALFVQAEVDSQLWYRYRIRGRSKAWHAAVFDLRLNTNRMLDAIARHARQARRTFNRWRVSKG